MNKKKAVVLTALVLVVGLGLAAWAALATTTPYDFSFLRDAEYQGALPEEAAFFADQNWRAQLSKGEDASRPYDAFTSAIPAELLIEKAGRELQPSYDVSADAGFLTAVYQGEGERPKYVRIVKLERETLVLVRKTEDANPVRSLQRWWVRQTHSFP